MDTGGERYEGDIIFATHQPNSRSLEIPPNDFRMQSRQKLFRSQGNY